MSQVIAGNCYDLLSILLCHPEQNYLDVVEALSEFSTSKHGVRHLRAFMSEMSGLSLSEIQELYSKTFDLSPLCSPALSVHLFGVESFKRSHLMVGLLDMYAKASYASSGESADHMSTVIGFLPYASLSEQKEITSFIVLPGLKKMAEFLGTRNNPFAHLLFGTCEIVEAEVRREAVHA